MDLKQLFSLRQPTSQSTPADQNTTQIKDRETYTQYGIRICGMTTGRLNALEAHLNKVYNIEISRQKDDEAFQQSKRDELASTKAKKETDKNNEESSISHAELEKQNLEDKKAEIKAELDALKANEGTLNRMQRMKLIISLLIIAPLTVYLFIFYNSTFYSAFFKEFGYTEMAVGAAMFDSQAIPAAAQHGFGELLFILFAPVIFLGFGIAIHFVLDFKNNIKYLATIFLVTITFIFDCILAYLIAEKIYNIEILNSLDNPGPFTLSEAIGDPNFWAVIFCGFIVYLIWGLLFFMAMSAYEHMRSNKEEIVAARSRMDSVNTKIQTIDAKILDHRSNINKLNGEIAAIETSLSQSSFINTTRIKTALNDFYAGWMQVMNTFNHEEEAQCPGIYSRIVNTLCHE